jgi:hypothetical protein
MSRCGLAAVRRNPAAAPMGALGRAGQIPSSGSLAVA